MPASDPELHNFFEAKPRMVGKVGAGGVPSESSTTIPHTFVGLTDGVAYIVTANRVNATGTEKNKVNETETFIGVANGENFINCVRGVEGAPQAWSADVVLEILFTAFSWNKLIDGIEKEHNQDGTHKLDAILPDNLVTTDGEETLENKTIINSTVKTSEITATDGPTVTFDLNASNKHKVVLGGNRTFALTGGYLGQFFTIKTVQDATGNRGITWWSGISWAGGSAPDNTKTASKADRYGFVVTGVDGGGIPNAFEGHVIGQDF